MIIDEEKCCDIILSKKKKLQSTIYDFIFREREKLSYICIHTYICWCIYCSQRKEKK